jgi:hypothetical protein
MRRAREGDEGRDGCAHVTVHVCARTRLRYMYFVMAFATLCVYGSPQRELTPHFFRSIHFRSDFLAFLDHAVSRHYSRYIGGA